MRTAVASLASAGALALALASPAAASAPIGGCPPGGPGEWMLVSANTPATIFVDTHGNNDGYACKVVFTNGSGTVVGQVIDDVVQAPQ
jgi:hypothetical protein